MPAAIAIPLITAAAAGGTAAAGIYGAKKSSESNDKAAQIQKDSSDKATALAAQTEATRKAEYDAQQAELKRQWDVTEANKAPYRQISSDALLRVRDLLGLPPGASIGGGGAAAPSGGAPAASGPMPSINWTSDPNALGGQLSQFFKSRGVSDQETPYWVSKAGELVARGKEIGDPNYATKRLLAANVFGGGGVTRPPAAMGGAMAPPLGGTSAPTGLATNPNYAQVIPFRDLMRGVQ